jgi:hypothetical protein
LLNERLEENPEYPLPSGFIKVKERTESQKFKLPDNMMPFIGRARILIIPILDELIDELFKVHYLEPFVSYEDHVKVKAIL